jgi:hypothetical protein
MRKKLIPIYSVLVVAMILLAALAPSCGGGSTTGTVVVQATLCGVAWQGAVNYTLTLAGGTSPVSGTGVPTTHGNMTPGAWTCGGVSGGPAGAFLNSIKPSATQNLAADGTITFTLDFELDQDAAIRFLSWSLNGEPQEVQSEIVAMPCMIIDTHFKQWVKGCDGYNVTMNEASWLTITAHPANPGPATIIVVDDWCALNKTPTPRQKVSQTVSVDNVTREKGYNVTLIPGGPPVLLDAHTQWNLVKGTNYTKLINWFGIWVGMYEPGLHPCVLFELIVPAPGMYQFTLVASADVELVGDTDVDPQNNHDISTPITLIVNAM